MLSEFERLHHRPLGVPGTQDDAGRFIDAYFGDRVCNWLDVGAFDGVTLSTTYALAQRGWRGVAMEPDPVALEALRQTYAGNPSIAIIGAALAGHDGTIRFHTSNGGAVSTTCDRHRQKWSGARFDTIEVPAISPPTLLKMYPAPFHFLSLDAEGTNAEVLEMLDLDAMGVELACVEHDGNPRRIERHCEKHGLYQRIYQSAGNVLIGR
jgi:FkbM family methyltransferase